MAILSRQSWRFLQNLGSLCACTLKARYFPHRSILEAEPRDGISYSWRSILDGIDLVKEGYIWRVGDGRQVNIWSDPWILRPWSRKVITPRGQNVLTPVSELICPATGSWDEQLVKDTL